MESVFEEWKFVKSIPIGSKPCFYSKSLIDVNGWFVTIRRRMGGEKGEKGVEYLKNLVKTTILQYRTYDKIEVLKNLKQLLEESILGLNNLSCTYSIDKQETVSEDYKKIVENVKEMVKELEFIISKKNKGVFFAPKKIKIISE